MHFLITNDDGFDAPGLVALHTALRSLGEVSVVAPAVCHSSQSHAVNTKDELVVEQRTFDPFGEIHVVHASPADCVRIGLRALGLPRPDVVVAGINPGANLGVDLFYSGTAAAAREAAMLGIPALAVSRYIRHPTEINWNTLSTHVSRMVATLVADPWRLPAGQFWNVNFPAVDQDHHAHDFTVAPMGLLPHDVGFERLESSDGRQVVRYKADYRSRGASRECDVSHVLSGRIVVTPVDLCNTAVHPQLSSRNIYPPDASFAN